jgi:uncharacterized protein YjlB
MQTLDPPASAQGSARAAPSDSPAVVQNREAETFCFEDDGLIPNHPAWPLIIYHDAVRLAEASDPAAVFEQLFAANGWGDGWRDGIYPTMHYHSRIHEVLGIARGVGRVRFGGARGRALTLKAGDVAVLPAGTGHQCIEASADFLVVGAYPPDGTYDECRNQDDRVRALCSIPRVARPGRDPVYGAAGPLTTQWKAGDCR